MLTWQAFVRQPAVLAGYDIAMMNLACAAGLPGSARIDVALCLNALDQIAAQTHRYTERVMPMFCRGQCDFPESEPRFRFQAMVTHLQRDLGLRYHPGKRSAGARFEPSDTFIHGILVKALEDKNDRIRLGAVQGIGQIGPEAKVAVPALVTVLKGVMGQAGQSRKVEEEMVLGYAAEAIGKLGQQADLCIPALINLLSDTSQAVRLKAVHALGEFGPQARSALPALTRAYNEGPLQGSEETRKAMESIQARSHSH